MQIFPTFVRRARRLAGKANARMDAFVGWLIQTRIFVIVARPVVGLVQSVTAWLRQNQTVGLVHTVLVSGTARISQAMAYALSLRIQTAPIPTNAAAKVLHIQSDTQFSLYATGTQTYAVGNSNDWVNPQQFDDETPTEASISGGKGTANLTAKNGGIRAGFRQPRGTKDVMQLNAVTLRLYLRQTGTLLNNGTLVWGVEGSVPRTQLGGAAINLNGERVHDLTSLIGGDWQKLRGLQVYVEGSSANLGRACFARYAALDIQASDLETSA